MPKCAGLTGAHCVDVHLACGLGEGPLGPKPEAKPAPGLGVDEPLDAVGLVPRLGSRRLRSVRSAVRPKKPSAGATKDPPVKRSSPYSNLCQPVRAGLCSAVRAQAAGALSAP